MGRVRGGVNINLGVRLGRGRQVGGGRWAVAGGWWLTGCSVGMGWLVGRQCQPGQIVLYFSM